MATYEDLENFSYAELMKFKSIELNVLKLDEISKRLSYSQQKLPPCLSEAATKTAKKFNFPKITTLTEFISFSNAVLKLLLTATGKNNLPELVDLIARVNDHFSSLK